MNKDNARDYLPLVQALAEGKVIQMLEGHGYWVDMVEISSEIPARLYRIKPEPREIWVNHHEEVGLGYNFYASKEAAADGIRPGWKPVCFREVIE
jgi:hypothetical protein